MSDQIEFPLGDILTLVSGNYVSRTDLGDELVDFLCRGEWCDHVLDEAVEACAASLIDQHPWLQPLSTSPNAEVRSWARRWAWLDRCERRHGKIVPVRSMTKTEWPSAEQDTEGPTVTTVVVDMNDPESIAQLPPELQTYLRDQGII